MHAANAITMDGRNEKLLAARRKLKQFQSRRRPSYRSYGVDDESSGQSYANEENQAGERYGDRGRRYHSQQRQPAESQRPDGRPLSACYAGYSTESLAESTASTTKATNASRARRASAASSRYLETPEPVRISVPPEQPEILFRQHPGRQQVGGAFYHDEQRSPFQRVKRESESSEATIHSPSGPPDAQFNRDSTQNEFSSSSSSSTETENRQTSKTDGSGYAATAKRIGMDPVDPTARTIAVAGSTISSRSRSGDGDIVVSIDEINPECVSAQTPANDEVKSLRAGCNFTAGSDASDYGVSQSHLWKTNGQQHGEVLPPNPNIDYQLTDPTVQHLSYQTVVQQQESVIQQLNTQLQQLHVHYSQLHTAYSEIVQQHQQASAGGADANDREIDELRRQIQLHLHTMSVLVDEKTDLQSQLRQAMEIANQKHFESEELQGRLKANRDRLTTVETEFETNRSTYRNQEDTLRRQASELERLRKESAQWQARASEAQQDRSEMNAKLKVRSREVDDLAAKLKDAEKQLHLKEIYIQQLTGGPGALQQQQVLHDELEQQRRYNADVCAQLEQANKAVEHWRWESEQIRERYEAYVKQLNENAAALAERLEQAEKEKYSLQVQCDQLQKQLSSLGASDLAHLEPHRSSAEDLESLKLILNEFEQGLKAANSKTAELEHQLVEKEANVQALTDSLNERERHIRQLTDQLNEKYQHDESSKNLLEQLHNEKATLSRAVAQNIELKKQLVELQEKFVSMSEMSMENANKLESAERQVETLKEIIAQHDSEVKAMTDKHNNEMATLQERVNATDSQNFERSHMEDRLRHYEVVQKHFDAELERSQREIGHLKVEKADLSQRLVVLNDANKNLQNEIQRLAQQLLERNSQVNDEDEKLPNASEESQSYTNSAQSQEESRESSEDTKRQLLIYEQELGTARQRLQHLSTENAELHRIMEQNAEDENQNTIHVELHQALNRSTALSNDNEGLRQRVQELETQLAREKLRDSPIQAGSYTGPRLDQAERPAGGYSYSAQCHHNPSETNGDDRSSVCSEHNDQRRETVNLENLKSAMEQLQQRFAKAMNENADLADQNQQLEHLITHLQSETETIGEYITIYQHQRKTIRERLKEKEEYVAKLAREKEDMQGKVAELQQLVVRLLRDRGALRQYAQAKPVYGRPPPSPPSIAPRKPRALSQTVVDEVTGSEVSPKGANENVAEAAAADSPSDPVPSAGDASPTFSESSQIKSSSPTPPEQESLEQKRRDSFNNSPDTSLHKIITDINEDDATAERILRLLTEMRRPDLVNLLPPADRSLHCKYCTGRLMML